jgi:uncharacterized protein (TIGR03435 family)
VTFAPLRSALLPLLFLCATGLGAQSFEVATVKVNRSGPEAGNGFYPSPGLLRVTNCTLEQMMRSAFHVNDATLAGAVGWMQSERYDIEAKAPVHASFDEELDMLRALLIERFQLRFHTEKRQVVTFALVLGKNGPKFHASKDDGAGGKERITIRPTEISGFNIPFGHFVSVLGAQLHRSVTNDTGLSGNFDLALKYVRDDAPNAAEGSTVFAALEDQLGLKLESHKGPVDVMVIDAAGKPRGN